MARTLAELQPVSLSTQSISAIRTGTWKYVEPLYLDKLPPCSHLCPAGNDISKFLSLTAQGDIESAARLIRSGNPLPATLGRVCPHPCESQCNRVQMGGAIAIHMMERFLGDESLGERFVPSRAASTGKRVAVIGGGPAGLAAAYNLALQGHAVEVFDDKAAPGGYLRTGIPDYRLPRSVLDREIDLIRATGVGFKSNFRVGRDAAFAELRQQFDAIILALGFHRTRALDVPGENSPGVHNGVQLLERILSGGRPDGIRRPAIVGGGNTAMDAARSLLRTGATPIVVYRRTRAEMPAIPAEVDEAVAEGIPFHFLTAPVRVVIEGGRVTGLSCIRMTLGDPDSSGRRRPLPVAGSEHVVPCDSVVTAIGETTDLDDFPEELREGWRIAGDERLATSLPGVFGAGDAIDGNGTVTAAVGCGRRVADVVNAFLVGHDLPARAPRVIDLWRRGLDREHVSYFDQLNTAYLRPELRPEIVELPPAGRTGSFAEVVQGFTSRDALAEARRCFVCGTCNECHNCYYFCPDVAIHKRRSEFGFDIDSDHCKGCGVCVEECPRDAMVLVEVGR